MGGLIGYDITGAASNCYAVGTVSGAANACGLIGAAETAVAGRFYNSLNAGSSVGAAASLVDMKFQATYVGWDFTDVWGIDPGRNGGFPYLRSIDF